MDKFKGIITEIVAVFLTGKNLVGVFDLHAADPSECQKS